MLEKIEISPADIRHKEFKTSALGYSKVEIREYLETLAEYFEDLYSQSLIKNKASSQVMVQEVISQNTISLEEIQRKEDLIARTLIHAENTRNEIIRNAQIDAENIIRYAELSAKKAIEETRRYLNIMKQEFVNIKDSHRQFLNSTHTQLKVQLNRLELDPLFSKQTEGEVNSKFEEVSRIKIEIMQETEEPVKPVTSPPIREHIETVPASSDPSVEDDFEETISPATPILENQLYDEIPINSSRDTDEKKEEKEDDPAILYYP